jgi:hypothetical protein
LSWAAVSLSGYLKADGTVPLTAAWDAGEYGITALNLTADPTLSAEQLTNVAGWTPAGNWTYAGGKWSHATGSATALTATGETAIVAGTKYEIVITNTTSTAGGGVNVTLGGVITAVFNSTGTNTYNITAKTTGALILTPASGTWVGSIDSISVKILAANTGTINADEIVLNSGRLNLAGYGNASYPAIVAGPYTTTGLFFSYLTGEPSIAISGAENFKFGSASTMYMLLNTAAIYMGANSDLVISRDAAATLQIGADSASASTNQIIKAHDRTGTDAAGASLIVKGGNSTGAGLGGSFEAWTAPASGAGAGVNGPIKRFEVDSAGTVAAIGVNSQATNIKQATVTVTTTAAATATATNLIPAGSMVIGITTRVTTAVTGDAGFTGFNIGDGSDVDRWGANVTPTVDQTTDLTDCTVTTPPIYAAATSVVLTQVGGSTFVAGGVVRITVHYISLTAPTA